MTSSSTTPSEPYSFRFDIQKDCTKVRCRSSNWTKSNTILMVLGFIFFWPLGLFCLYWILSGRQIKDMPRTLFRKTARLFKGKHQDSIDTLFDDEPSTNEVFNAYQQTQYDRIREIKDEIKSRSQRFREFREDARRRADEEEFNRFMASTPPPPSQ